MGPRPVASSPSVRRNRAHESFQTAAECIGPVTPGMALFAITRGQFSMIDAIHHVLSEVGLARLTVWTWTIASYEMDTFCSLMTDRRLTDGLLIIDGGARYKNADIIDQWHSTFGPKSVRYVRNHAKIATVTTDDLKIVIRGSMNLNFNPRFEQFDLTEGGPEWDLIRQIEDDLPVVHPASSNYERDVYKSSRLGDAFDQDTITAFSRIKQWAK